MRSMIRSSLVSIVIMGLLLFAPAGTVAWWQAWVLLVLFTVCGLVTASWLNKIDPELLRERSQSVLGAGQRPYDRLIMGALLAFFAVWMVAMALDARRFGWSHVPPWAQVLGAILIVSTYVGFAVVFRTNRFAVTQVKLQAERSQTVISTGPYAVVRHPMYGISLVLMIGVSLLLGSLWGLLGVVVGLLLFGARALGEEQLLMDGLPGYRAYAAKVRWRLVPGVW